MGDFISESFGYISDPAAYKSDCMLIRHYPCGYEAVGLIYQMWYIKSRVAVSFIQSLKI
jgi:hypothetical protein